MIPDLPIFITAKDVEKLTGKKQKACYSILQRIKKYLNKEKHQNITFADFYNYYGVEFTDDLFKAAYIYYFQNKDDKPKDKNAADPTAPKGK